MKLFTFIFSLYMLALSCLPCSDQDDCNMVLQSQLISTTSGHDDHEHDKDHCPPFCQCTCCGVAGFYEFTTPQIDSFITTISENISIYTAPTLSEVYINIWQPPKLS